MTMAVCRYRSPQRTTNEAIIEDPIDFREACRTTVVTKAAVLIATRYLHLGQPSHEYCHAA